jgi:hypothetical protein
MIGGSRAPFSIHATARPQVSKIVANRKAVGEYSQRNNMSGHRVTGKHLKQSNSIDGDAAGDKNRVTGMQFEEQIAIWLLFSVLICCQGENVTVLIVYIRTGRFSPFFFQLHSLTGPVRQNSARVPSAFPPLLLAQSNRK